jgi:tight adherence protein C
MTLLSILALCLFGGSIALLLRAVALPRTRASARIREIEAYGFSAASAATSGPRSTNDPALSNLAGVIGDALARRIRSFHPDELRKEIVAAGLYRLTPRVLLGYRALSMIGIGTLSALAVAGSSPIVVTLVTLLGAAVGWIGPLMFVRRRARFRMSAIDRGLADLIDLLVVTVEAGLGLGASLNLAASRTPGPLGQELQIVMQEQRIGSSLGDALEAMLERADTAATRSFVRSLAQGETLGVSIGSIMRNLATDMRKRRRLSIEEQAQKTPVKILFPLVFLILPALLIVVLGPALYDLSDSLAGL